MQLTKINFKLLCEHFQSLIWDETDLTTNFDNFQIQQIALSELLLQISWSCYINFARIIMDYDKNFEN